MSTSEKKTKVSLSKKAGVKFPVGRITRFIKQGNYVDRVSPTASVAVAAALNFLVAEVFDLTIQETKNLNIKRITPRAIYLALNRDEELRKITSHTIIPQAGVVPKFDKMVKKNTKNQKQTPTKKKVKIYPEIQPLEISQVFHSLDKLQESIDTANELKNESIQEEQKTSIPVELEPAESAKETTQTVSCETFPAADPIQ